MIKTKPRVKVLMSTYNGEKYLEKQIESILSQKDVEVDIDIRDDGSSDNTLKLLSKYRKNNINIHVKTGNNKGPSHSFMELLYNSDYGFDYYAFSDQDDIWQDDKLTCAIKKISKLDSSAAVLYYSALMTFQNETGKIVLRINDRELMFNETFIQSQYPGCTMVFNNTAFQLIREIECPKTVIMHDLYVVQVLMGMNKHIIYDEESHIKYRIHGNNVSVKPKKIFDKMNRIRRIISKQKNLRLNSAKEYYRVMYHRLAPEHKRTMETITQYDRSWSNKNEMIKMISQTAFGNNIRTAYIVAVLFDFY